VDLGLIFDAVGEFAFILICLEVELHHRLSFCVLFKSVVDNNETSLLSLHSRFIRIFLVVLFS
jgi:hypothetical protein